MVPALACIKWFDCHLIKWFDCHLPGAVVSQGISRPNAENCSGFLPPNRQSASIEAELLIKWFDCHLPGAVVSQGISRPNAENCSGFLPPNRQSASIEAELLGLTSIYSELCLCLNPKI